MPFSHLLSPVQIGPLSLPNRVVMAPLTRQRSKEPGDIPTPLMAEYYRQRASAGLIISEATQVSFEAKGSSGAPGLHTAEQMAGWAEVLNGVHQAGGQMVVQLWHTGRVSHSSLQPGGRAPGAPSALAAENTRTTIRDESGQKVRVPTSVPRELSTEEIAGIVGDFVQTIRNAREVGFDMVELHGAHGYLIHQFLSPASNNRTDAYGGSVENRARFALEVADAAIAAWSAERIGFRIYPLGTFHGMDNGVDQEDAALYLIEELAKRSIGYLHISEPDWVGGTPLRMEFRQAIRKAFPGKIIAAGAYTPEKAENLIAAGLIDAVAFGRLFIANPDLPRRIAQNGPYNALRGENNYDGEAVGYTDYPCLTEAVSG